ncbi:MAG: hypothetical protein LBD28_03135 [Tannerellaceae bacterium]|jgi:hypothetical protein|nr:hypothetical protein [Tannerellaceae bacterium]
MSAKNVAVQPTSSDPTKESLLRATGISYEEMQSMDIEEIHARIEKKIGKKLTFKPNTDMRLIGRGSPYLYLNRVFQFDEKKLDKFIDSLRLLK